MTRLGGWLLIGLLVAHLVVLHTKITSQSDRVKLQAPTAMTAVILVSVFNPWLLIRREKVELEAPSGAVTVAHFSGHPAAGTFARVSTSPLLEWHSFSCAARGYNANMQPTFKIIMASAGDWTKGLAQQLKEKQGPSHMWIRYVKPPGFMYAIKAYRRAGQRVVAIATGAGIAPVLPHLIDSTELIHVVWIARDHRKTYGDTISNLVFDLPDVTIYDSGVSGRPDVNVALLPYYQSNAAAIFVVSNEPFTAACMKECAKRNIPCYGATRDS